MTFYQDVYLLLLWFNVLWLKWMCDECTWHHKTFLVQSVYWHLAIKLYCSVLNMYAETDTMMPLTRYTDAMMPLNRYTKPEPAVPLDRCTQRQILWCHYRADSLRVVFLPYLVPVPPPTNPTLAKDRRVSIENVPWGADTRGISAVWVRTVQTWSQTDRV